MVEFEEKEINGVKLLAVSGRLDVNAVEQIGDDLKQRAGQDQIKVILDLTEVDYLSSRGLGLLIELSQTNGRAGGMLRLVSVHPLVNEVLEITGSRELFSIHDSVEDALRSLK